ncbi:Sel1 [Shewanella denitrificans OS217]|uniref:Sel1 n=1 Tax=Shewanella denitrificans (strain OS217 / ATCC BAA-1090 / DSM 15013) TaxID=318161 RepID=Q12Q56_SHEDO|nr:sel1 repeat family protein [Shewanella denitrificans]ABE54420.1 Sel1 [Shewanella denitrificans OS217]
MYSNSIKSIAIVLLCLSSFFTHADVNSLFKEAMSKVNNGDCESGVLLLHELADRNLPGALINLGSIYESGKCGSEDLARANELFKIASEMSIPIGHYRYGLLHFGDDSYKPDYKLVFREWSKAFKLGLPIYSELAILHHEGLGTHKNALLAEMLLIKGVKQGDVQATEQLKGFYLDKSSPLYNPEKAKNFR